MECKECVKRDIFKKHYNYDYRTNENVNHMNDNIGFKTPAQKTLVLLTFKKKKSE